MPARNEKIRVFIGSGEASVLERKTLIHSIRKNTKHDVDIYVFNGTHNSIELNDNPPVPAPMSLRVKYRNITEFSLYRFLIPEICGHQGRAIFMDSDTVCLGDVSELFDQPMIDYDFLCKRDAYTGTDMWGLSVTLMDCSRTRFDLEAIFDEIDRGLYTYTDFVGMSGAFLKHRSFKIGPLDPEWNVFDRFDSETKLIHYTNLYTQPWKYPNHPYGELWFEYFQEARRAGAISDVDIEIAKVRSYVRTNILKGNYSFLGREMNFFRGLYRGMRKTAKAILKKA